jgi:hypothetical protein
MEHTSAQRLNDEELREFLALAKGADSVELKVTVPDEDRSSTIAALDMDRLDAYLREVYFFDTPDLALDAAGVVARARRSQGRPDDSVVKLRPVEPPDLPPKLRETEDFGVEVDAMPGGFVCSGSYKARVGRNKVRPAVRGERPLRKLFTKEQRAFFEEHAPDGVDIDGLAILGPVIVAKIKWQPDDYDRKIVAELWNYPDGVRILELSTKCAPDEAIQVAAETRAYLDGRGVDLSGEQQTKTRTALEYFSGLARGEPAAAGAGA